uniref:HTH CENPB-type domain-containing protein n=1 Tax=Branchiostoma floridae TaxID=7739 RepID=C3ZQV5_BRAFL|eukprot:XP_002589140.1 hypothetical protein BRAFLDRAFT_75117 [Branchiostoma floridae]
MKYLPDVPCEVQHPEIDRITVSKNILQSYEQERIVKRKQDHLEDFENNAPTGKKRRTCNTGNEEINRLCWEFYRDTTTRLVTCSGPMLQEAARKFAKELGVTEFKASNGWLESFKKRHNIGRSTMVGESAGVDKIVVGGLATCDTTGTNWNQPVSATLQQLHAEKEEDGDTNDVEDDGEEDGLENFSMFMECIQKMKHFCLKEGFGEGLVLLHDLDDVSCETWNKRRAQAKQTT